MIFNNLHLASFGRCKVLSWKSSIYSDFDRNELTYRGRVLAAVEVPTVRSVEATILVRGSTIKDVDKRLSDISKWLFGAGTSKLFSERDTTHYFLARCTQVSKPEYSGASARISVVFTCDDSRLYAVYNDEPITTATSAMNNFTFNGKHCLNDMQCVFVLDTMDASPKVIANTYQISGRSGTLRYSNGSGVRLEEKGMSGSLYFVKPTASDGLMSDSEISERMHKIASWLCNAERAYLILDSDISRRYMAEIVDATTLTRKDWENGSVKIKFVLQPYSESVTSKTYSNSFVLGAVTEQDVPLTSIVPNGIGYETQLVLEITNSSSTAITDLYIYYYDEKNSKKTMRLYGNGFSVANGQTIKIDGPSYSITKGTTAGIQWLKSGDFPVLSVGGNKKIRIKSATAATVAVTVRFNERWL